MAEKKCQANNYSNWVNWCNEQEIFKKGVIDIKDTLVTEKNHYGETMQARIFHVKHNKPDLVNQHHKHLVMFMDANFLRSAGSMN